jgi:branched-chain amino acid transport system substrate-binding protein
MLELLVEDGQCNGKDATSAMQKLVNVDGVKFVIGGFCSSESLAIVPVGEEAGVLMFSPGSSSPDLTGISDLFVRNFPSDATQGSVLAELANNKGWTKAAFVQEQTDAALGIRNAFTENFEALGREVVAEVFPTENTDFRTALTKLRSEEPDVLFISVQTPAVAERILIQLTDLGWEVPLIAADVVSGAVDLVEANAEALEGTFAAEFGIDPENEKFQNFIEAYKAEYGEEPPFQSYAQTEWDSVFMLADALEEVGEDPESVAKWLREVDDWQGASGNVVIGDNGDRVSGHVLKIITDGKTEIYSPEESEE